MATVDKEFADNIALNNGYYNGDDDNSMGDNPRVFLIIKYRNAFGGDGYALIFEGGDPRKYMPSHFVRNPEAYWVYKGK